jgi:hypothetical protein
MIYLNFETNMQINLLKDISTIYVPNGTGAVMMKGSLHCMQEIIHSTGTTLKYHINTNLRGNVSTFNHNST